MNVCASPVLQRRQPRVRPVRRTIALGLCLLLLVGCGIAASPTPEPVVINFAFPAQLANFYDEMIQTFNEEHPSLTVQRKTARSPGTWNSFFQNGEVDVFMFLSEDELFSTLYEQDQVLNLSPLLQADEQIDVNDIYPSLLEPYRIEGDLWAIPGGANLVVTYYNKDLLNRYNAAYPEPGWTWDDLQQTALSIRDPAEGIYGLTAPPFSAIPFVYQHGGRIVDDWRRPTRLMVAEPLTIEAIEWYASLIHDYDVMPSPREAERQFGNEGSPGYIFWRQKTGMYLGFYSDRGGETWGRGARWQMEWGMAPLPRDTNAATLGVVLAYAASADTRYPEACWEWITYLSRRPPPFVIPSRRSLAESSAFAEQVGAETAEVARATIENALIVSSAQIQGLGSEGGEGFDQALEAILNGDVDALSALTELQDKIDAQ